MFKLRKDERHITEYQPSGPIKNFPAIIFLSYEKHTDPISDASSEYLEIFFNFSKKKKKDYECIRSNGKLEVTSNCLDDGCKIDIKKDLESIDSKTLDEVLQQILPEAQSIIRTLLEAVLKPSKNQ